ncbi:MAG TPA: amino acid adenylation domain-containing protein, partial [Chitinophagaceae bacterium]|nr:amino acid adenylation domain-containing protein [Chitinophagaceae bacterium]
QFDVDTTHKINVFAKANRITVSTIMQGVWARLLHTYTGNKNVVYGVTVSGRPDELTNVEQRVGMFINTIPLHSNVSDDQDVIVWLKQLQEEQLSSRYYQHTSLNDIQGWTGIQGDLFDSIVVFENYPVSKLIAAKQWKLQVDNVQTGEQSNYPLNILVQSATEITIRFSYNSNLLEEVYVEQISRHFEHILTQIIVAENASLGDLKVLTAIEEDRLIVGFNNTQQSYPKDKNIIDLFEEQVSQHPGHTALLFQTESITYEELNKRSNQLANYLKSIGVKEEMLVPICIERSVEMIIGILGILKAGAAYVPIDSSYPAERISYILADTTAHFILTSKKSKQALSLNQAIDVIEIDGAALNLIELQPANKLPVTAHPGQLAYVIYTSGSTGKPKGTMVEHGNVVSLVKGTDYVTPHTNDIVLSTGSPSFDATTFEYWSMLLNGGTLVLCPEERLLNSDLLKDEIRKRGVTLMWFTSSWFNQLVDSDMSVFEGLKTILVGGEKLSPPHILRMRETHPDIQLSNGYGPTENTTFSVTCNINETEMGESVPIGRPLNNRQAYILGIGMKPVPVGVTGEIYLGGAGLSRGYLNMPELTNEKFIRNPYSDDPASRLYKTGDLGKWLPNGNICYLGRVDDQVKVRGYRIEPGEVEKALQQSGLVNQSVVLARENNSGTNRLIGYVVPADNYSKDAVMEYLRNGLPEYMVPQLWVELEKLPLTPNGKVDKRALPDVDSNDLVASQYTAPRNKLEEELADIWQDLLDIERVGIHDNFFELGGDSILTIQLVSRTRRAGYELQVPDVFTYQTIATLSKIIEDYSTPEIRDEAGPLTGISGLLPVQQWYLTKKNAAVSHFNQSVLLKIDKRVTEAVLTEAIQQLVHSHDALRFTYSLSDDGWKQEYAGYINPLVTVNLDIVTDESLPMLINKNADHFQRSLNIEKGEIIRVALMLTPGSEKENRLLIVIHHLVVDGVSWRILLEDLEILIEGIHDGKRAVPGKKSISYRRWYEILVDYGQSKHGLAQKDYWHKALESYNALPVDRIHNGVLTAKDMANHSIQLAADKTRCLLQEVPRVYHTEINDILLCALAATLCKWAGISKVVIGLEGHGREEVAVNIDTSRTVGWFTTLYPLLLEMGKLTEPGEMIKSVKEQLRTLPDKGLAYGVLKYINKEEVLQNKPGWDILFNYLGQLDN